MYNLLFIAFPFDSFSDKITCQLDQREKKTLPPAQRACGPAGTLNPEPLNGYVYFSITSYSISLINLISKPSP